MKISGNDLLAVLLCVGAFALILVVRFILNAGANKVTDKLHDISKRKIAANLPQGRFRLEDRYDGTLNASIAKKREGRSKSQQIRAPVVRTDKSESRNETILSGEEWKMDEESINADEWELDAEAKTDPSPSRIRANTVQQPEAYYAPRHASQPVQQQKSDPTPSRMTHQSRVTEERTEQHISSEPEASLLASDILETIPPFQENRCCICNGELYGTYAVLFKADSGAEARIDRDCAVQFNTIVKSTDPEKIVDARRYLVSRYDAVDPKVAPYLKKYAKVAYDRLKQWKETN